MAALALNSVSLTGTPPTFGAATSGGDTFTNTGTCYLHVKTAGTACTVTVSGSSPCDQGFTHDAVVAIGATAEARIGPFPIKRFGRNGNITYTAVTGVTVALVGLSS